MAAARERDRFRNRRAAAIEAPARNLLNICAGAEPFRPDRCARLMHHLRRRHCPGGRLHEYVVGSDPARVVGTEAPIGVLPRGGDDCAADDGQRLGHRPPGARRVGHKRDRANRGRRADGRRADADWCRTAAKAIRRMHRVGCSAAPSAATYVVFADTGTADATLRITDRRMGIYRAATYVADTAITAQFPPRGSGAR